MAHLFPNNPNALKNISYSGTDIIPVVSTYNKKGIVLGYLATCSYSVHTDFSPVKVCGDFNPKSFTRGSRLIAGSFVSIVFDKSTLIEAYNKDSYYTAHRPTSGHLPVFDIMLMFSNEYGKESVLTIYGVRVMDEGQVHSVDDIYTENTMSFVAQDIRLITDGTEMDPSEFKVSSNNYLFNSTPYATERTYKGISQSSTVDIKNKIINESIRYYK